MKCFRTWAVFFALFSCLASCVAPIEVGAGDAAPTVTGSTGHRSHGTSVSRNISYGDHLEQNLDLYLQGAWVGEPTFFERAPEPRPTLLFFHGGGWLVRDKRLGPLASPFLERGWHVVSATYRVGPHTAPLAVDDAVCALNWVVANADQFGFDREAIVVAGGSAGGHLALTTGVLGSRPGHGCYPGDGFNVEAVVNWFGITDIAALERFLSKKDSGSDNYALAWIGNAARVADISASYSPIHMIDDSSPPVITIHGTDDTIVPYEQAWMLHKKLDALGTPNELVTLSGGKHGGFTNAQFQEAFTAINAFVAARE